MLERIEQVLDEQVRPYLQGHGGAVEVRELTEDGLLRVDCADPESDPGTGLETTLWFQPDSHQLIRGELSRDGFRAIRCDFSVFAKT